MKDRHPFLSVIILVYHDDQFLKNCLSSLFLALKKAKVSYELIFVANDIALKKSKFNFPNRSRVIFNRKNVGFAKAFNQGAKLSSGRWLLSINPDTISDSDLLKNLLLHTKNSYVGAVTPKILNPDGTLQFTITNDFTIKNLIIEQFYIHKMFPWFFSSPQSDPRHYEKPHAVDFSFGTCFLIRSSLFKLISGFCEDFFLYLEDYDFCKKVRGAGYYIMFEPKAIQIHFGSRSNKGYKDGKAYLRSVCQYVLHGHNRYYTYVLISILWIGSFFRYLYWIFQLYFLKKDFSLKKVSFYRTLLFAK